MTPRGSRWRRCASAARNLLRGEARDADLRADVQAYADLLTDEKIAAGMPADRARRAALLEMGGLDLVTERTRDARAGAWAAEALQDARHAVRTMRRQPGFTLVATVTLALTIGTATTMFTVVNGVLLRPLPYADGGRLALLWTHDVVRGLPRESTATATILDWQRLAQTLDDVAYFTTGRAAIAVGGATRRTTLGHVSHNLFAVLGVTPILGRWFQPDDERNGAPVAMISHSLWLQAFGAAPDIVGRPLVLTDWQADGAPAALQIVGVMPAGFSFPDERTEAWILAAHDLPPGERTERFASWARRWTGVGRTRAGVSTDDVRAEFARVTARLIDEHPDAPPSFPGFAVTVTPLLDTIAGPRLQFMLWLLLGAVGLVLLLACANVGSLLLARGTAREHEVAIRRALGAARGRLVRQFLAESLVLALAGGAAGVGLAWAATGLLAVLAQRQLPRTDQITIDATVVAFAAAASVLSALVFGLWPAWRASDWRLPQAIKASVGAGHPRRRAAGDVLVAVQCAAAVVLLVGAGLLLRSLARVHDVDPGFETAHVLVLRVEFPREVPAAAGADESARAAARQQAVHDLLARLSASAGVERAGFIDDLFLTGGGNKSIVFPGRSVEAATVAELTDGWISPDFFATLRTPLRRGRALAPEDVRTKIRALAASVPASPGSPLEDRARRATAEPVIVNETFVRRFLPGREPLGERFCIDPTNRTHCFDIVGVVADMRRQGPERQAIAQYFGSFIPASSGRGDLLVRTQGDPLAAAAGLRSLVEETLPGAVVSGVATAESEVAAYSAERRLQAWLLALFASVALSLAAFGTFALVHHAVGRRVQEMAVRLSLGAQPRDVGTMVLRQGMRPPLAGLAAGLVIALGASRLLTHLVFGIETTDLVTYAAVTAAVGGAALLACAIPARRAARLDPVRALRLQ